MRMHTIDFSDMLLYVKLYPNIKEYCIKAFPKQELKVFQIITKQQFNKTT